LPGTPAHCSSVEILLESRVLELVDRILSGPEFTAEPPVLVEVGASGGTNAKWRALAPYSICIAFDPDVRAMQAVHAETSGYKRLFVIPAAAVADDVSEAEFHLTRSPQCSSRLRPDAAALGNWSFARLFDVERTVRVPCAGLQKALREAGVSRVDWFKSDSQGTDLRLFQSLGEALCLRTLAVEFEPGIIDAYEGEDKLSAVLAAMDRPEFWLCDLDIRGTLRMSPEDAGLLENGRTGLASKVLRSAPGWGEMTYLNTLHGSGPFAKRDWLLAWVIATTREQHGFALDLVRRAGAATSEPVFAELARESERIIRKKLRRSEARHRMRIGLRGLRSMARRVLKGPPPAQS
jgi:FkbM family methyltransferase